MTAPERSSPADAARFTMDLGRALHAHGVPTHRLEDMLNACARFFGLDGQFLALPTSITAGIGPDDRQHVWLVRTEPGRVNLERLVQLDGVFEAVTRRGMTPAEGSWTIAQILATPARWNAGVRALAFMLASAASSQFLGGGLLELAVGAVAGLIVGLIAMVTTRVPALDRIFEPLAATAVSFGVLAATRIDSALNVRVAIAAGLIGLVPGFTLTVAMTELATRQLVAGTTRLMGAVLLFMTIGFGTALGDRLGIIAFGPPPPPGETTPIPWLVWGSLIPVAASFMVLFSARTKDAFAMFVACAVAFVGVRFGKAVLGPELGVSVGAWLVGVVGYAYSRAFNRPSSVMLVPGVMMLVPGSIGFRSVAFLLERDVLSGVDTAFAMVLSAVSLVTGLLLASATLPPRRAL